MTRLFLCGPLSAEVSDLARRLGLVPDLAAGQTAILVGYGLRVSAGAAFWPHLVAAPNHQVAGCIYGDVSDESRARFLGFAQALGLRVATLPVVCGTHVVEALILLPDAPALARTSQAAPLWDRRDWSDRFAPAACLAADRWAEAWDVAPKAQRPGHFALLMLRAEHEVQEGARPTSLRHHTAPGDVTVADLRRPYDQFFAIEEYDLRLRRFAGGQSRLMSRAAFVSADAVTVCPMMRCGTACWWSNSSALVPLAAAIRNPSRLRPLPGESIWGKPRNRPRGARRPKRRAWHCSG